MAASTKTPWEVSDFSGGISDNIFSGQLNAAFVLDNFDVGPDKKLYSRQGSVLDQAVHSPIPAGNQRIGLLVNYGRGDMLFAQSAKSFYYRPAASTWTTLQGPSGNDVLTLGSTANFVSTSEFNRQMFVVSDAFANPMRIYKDGSGNYKVRNAGLPALATKPTCTPGAGANSYVYTFHYKYLYTVGAQNFEDLGPTTLVQVSSAASPSSSSVSITGIPVLTNAGSNNFDTANITVVIYRTIANGQVGYRLGEVANGTTTFTDNFADTAIQSNLISYTADGTLDFYPAVPAKFVHVVGSVGFYAYTSDSTGVHPYRIHQSVPGNPAFLPLTTWAEGIDEVKGVGSVKSLPILLCKRLIYRIDGLFDAQGRNGMTLTEIHQTAGCISHESCVEAEDHMFWAGNDGFYATDGYQVFKISDHLNTRFQAILKAMPATARIQGRFDETNRRVYWTVQQSAASPDNETILVLDLRWGVSNQMPFHTYSGPSFRPTSVEVFNSSMYRADHLGFVFQHSEQYLTDPKVNTVIPSDTWLNETIIWNYQSLQMNFGSTFFRKFVSRILLQAGNAGNTTIQVVAINDQGKLIRPLAIIRWRRNITWGDASFIWGSPDCVWAGEGLIEQWRRMPKKGLRLSYLQIQITNGLGVVINSDGSGLCTINPSTKTALLPSLWPSDSVDYYLTLANDNYVRKYQVSAINNSTDTLTLLDPTNQLPAAGSYEFELLGYAKGEPLALLGYNLHWENVDQNQQTFSTGDSGAN